MLDLESEVLALLKMLCVCENPEWLNMVFCSLNLFVISLKSSVY